MHTLIDNCRMLRTSNIQQKDNFHSREGKTDLELCQLNFTIVSTKTISYCIFDKGHVKVLSCMVLPLF